MHSVVKLVSMSRSTTLFSLIQYRVKSINMEVSLDSHQAKNDPMSSSSIKAPLINLSAITFAEQGSAQYNSDSAANITICGETTQCHD